MSYKTGKDSLNHLINHIQEQKQQTRAMSGLLWKDYVGERIAQNSIVADVNKGYLLIYTNHTSFVQLIRLKEADILAKLKKNYPSLQIKQVKVKVVDAQLINNETTAIEQKNLSKQKEVETPVITTTNNEQPDNLNPKFNQLIERMLKRAKGEDI